MDLAEIEKILSYVGSLSVGLIIGASIIYFLLKSFLPSYFSEKGKNLATKEDIESITDKVESVKTDYAKVLEELRSNNQLKLAEIEREKNIKKEVYLQAVEALTRFQNVIATLSNLNIDQQKIAAAMANDSGLIAKVQIVGSERTVKAVTTIMASIGTASMDLMLQRSLLVSRKTTIDVLEEYCSKKECEIDRYIEIMKNLNLEGNQDKRVWDTINNSIQFETRQRDEYSQKIGELWEIQKKEHLAFTQNCMNKFFETSSLLPDAVLAVRDELNFPISNDAYFNIFNANIDKARKVFGDFLEKISNS